MINLSRLLAISRRPVRAIASIRQSSSNSHDEGRTNKWHLLGIAAGATALAFSSSGDDRKSLNRLPVVEAATAKVLTGRRAQFNFISDVVEVSAPSVVYIEIQDTKRMDYFTGKPITASNGSGFIVDEDGLILTNAHVVINKPNSKVLVKLNDGRVFPGIVENVDSGEDFLLIHSNRPGP